MRVLCVGRLGAPLVPIKPVWATYTRLLLSSSSTKPLLLSFMSAYFVNTEPTSAPPSVSKLSVNTSLLMTMRSFLTAAAGASALGVAGIALGTAAAATGADVPGTAATPAGTLLAGVVATAGGLAAVVAGGKNVGF